VAGYHLQASDSGAWRLYTEDVTGAKRTLATGEAEAFGIGVWHELSLHFRGDQIIALLDGAELASVRDDSHTTGQVGLRTNAWQNAQFDNLEIVQTASPPEFVPHSEMSVSASSEHAENSFGSVFTATNAIDDRVETSWRPEFGRMAQSPQWITLDLNRTLNVCGLTCKPPVSNTANTVITSWKVSTSADNQVFEEVAQGTWNPSAATKTVRWPVRRARYVRLEAIGPWPQDGIAVNELNVIVPADKSDDLTTVGP
jgi:hypothetical protein